MNRPANPDDSLLVFFFGGGVSHPPYPPQVSPLINKLSLVGMQLLEKYKENFDVSSKGPGLNSLETSKLSSYFSGSCMSTNESLLILALPTMAQTIQNECTIIALIFHPARFPLFLSGNIFNIPL